MSMPTNIGVVDTMFDLPYRDRNWSQHFATLLRDRDSKEQAFKHPAGYMFKDPVDVERGDDPIGSTLREMDKFNIELALINVSDDVTRAAVLMHPDRFLANVLIDPNEGMEAVRKLDAAHSELNIVAASFFPCGVNVAIDDKRVYPIYAKCVELDIPIFVNAGVPGPRMPYKPQHVGLVDEVCWFFPDLKIVLRHGCEPWTELAVKLLLKWPNLYYSTSAFAPKFFPRDIIDFANKRGADKVIYAGYYPSGLSLERSFSELPDVPFRDHVWPKFLRDNALKVLKLTDRFPLAAPPEPAAATAKEGSDV
jgi:predicted TIM-barrel fold metal-dependent hydrolase